MALTPLELPGWLEINAWRTGLEAHRFSAATQGGPEFRGVFYLDRRGLVKDVQIPGMEPRGDAC